MGPLKVGRRGWGKAPQQGRISPPSHLTGPLVDPWWGAWWRPDVGAGGFPRQIAQKRPKNGQKREPQSRNIRPPWAGPRQAGVAPDGAPGGASAGAPSEELMQAWGPVSPQIAGKRPKNAKKTTANPRTAT